MSNTSEVTRCSDLQQIDFIFIYRTNLTLIISNHLCLLCPDAQGPYLHDMDLSPSCQCWNNFDYKALVLIHDVAAVVLNVLILNNLTGRHLTKSQKCALFVGLSAARKWLQLAGRRLTTCVFQLGHFPLHVWHNIAVSLKQILSAQIFPSIFGVCSVLAAFVTLLWCVCLVLHVCTMFFYVNFVYVCV